MNSLALSSESANWDLTVDASGNIAVVTGPTAVAQNVASALKTFLGEVFFDTTLGVPYFQQILGQEYSLSLLQAQFNAQALSVSDVVDAETTITSLTDRTVSGIVKFIDTTGQQNNAHF